MLPDKLPEPTAVDGVRSAVAVHVTRRRWLSFLRSTKGAMHALQISLICGMVLLLFGCSKEAGVPLSFYLSDQSQSGAAAVPTNTAALVVTQVESVALDAAQRKVIIKLLPADASSFKKPYTDNWGRTVVIVQGANVLATPPIQQLILAQAWITLPIATNVDFGPTYREILKLYRR